MSEVLEQWRAWIDAFEATVKDDNWERLKPFLTEDVEYRVMGVPFSTHVRGRDAVVAGLAQSVRHFDRRMDDCRWSPLAIRVDEPGYLRCHILSEYKRGDDWVLAFQAEGHWGFRDGKIDLMLDFYDPQHIDVQEALAWIHEHGEGLDPRYLS